MRIVDEPTRLAGGARGAADEILLTELRAELRRVGDEALHGRAGHPRVGDPIVERRHQLLLRHRWKTAERRVGGAIAVVAPVEARRRACMRHERREADLLAPRQPRRSLALAAEQVPYETRFAQVLSHAEIVARFSRALHATLAPGTTVARCSDPTNPRSPSRPLG